LNKSELVELIASSADISKSSAGDALEAVLDGITGALSSGNSVTLVGFGTFSVSHRTARDGRNPRTGETIQIKASNLAKFKAGKALKDALN
jgi:DNA-binding protein HU-beta